MKNRYGLILLLLSLVLPVSVIGAAAAESGRCVRCGMIVAQHVQWEGRIEYPDGRVESFCSPKCLLFTSPADRMLEKGVKLKLKDYYSTKFIDASVAWYVAGSDIMGPMGPDMVPFARKEDAESFLKDHNGEAIYSWSELTEEKLKALLPKKHGGKKHGS